MTCIGEELQFVTIKAVAAVSENVDQCEGGGNSQEDGRVAARSKGKRAVSGNRKHIGSTPHESLRWREDISSRTKVTVKKAVTICARH